MPLKAPFWWYRRKGAIALALAPLGRLYGDRAEARFARAEPYCSRLPVICIGNFTAGGGGKTPMAIAVAALLKELGQKPAFLTRGYGGTIEGPAFVEKGQSAEQVGDEPLLLAEIAPTMVAADRAAGAKAIEASEASVIVMDDGFQNPSLVKDLSLVVVDSESGIGNGLIMPAGPLRAPLDAQIARADALVVIGACAQGAHAVAPGQALAFRLAGDRLCRDRAAGEILRHVAQQWRPADRCAGLSRPLSL
jgi:tetraacyldisaccharide 4'-kinase